MNWVSVYFVFLALMMIGGVVAAISLTLGERGKRRAMEKIREEFVSIATEDIVNPEVRKQVEDSVGQGSKGIAMVAGGPVYGSMALRNIRSVRENGSDLPVTVFHIGPEELECESMKEIERLDNVSLVDLTTLVDWEMKPSRRDGFRSKVLAIIYSPYSEVLLLDADNMCLTKADRLFSIKEYEKEGALFWRDVSDWDEERYSHDRITGVARPYLFPDNARGMREVLVGMGIKDFQQQESGQMLVNKSRCKKALERCFHMNKRADIVYQVMWGDKDTFTLSWQLTDTGYHMAQPKPAIPGYMDKGNTFKDLGFMQRHPTSGSPLFFHRLGDHNKMETIEPTMIQYPRDDSTFHAYHDRVKYHDADLMAFDANTIGLKDSSTESV